MLITTKPQMHKLILKHLNINDSTKILSSQFLGNVKTLLDLGTGIGEHVRIWIGGSSIHVPTKNMGFYICYCIYTFDNAFKSLKKIKIIQNVKYDRTVYL